MSEPFVREAERLGLRNLVSMANLKIPLHGNGVVTRKAIIKSKRPMVAKFVRGITEAIYFIKNDKEATKAIIGKYTRFTIPKVWSALIETTWRFCWTYRMPIRRASRRYWMTWLHALPKPRRRIRKASSMRVSCRKWKLRDSSSSFQKSET